ncbi:MAG TPA: PQQ-binding-like beta-propeller repeat protein [Candidatus Kapabacteria bacterium]|nr:PQQ-binding-like beta-propeller repeat protein [Candidatus Kapabacteria bacterium]
MKSHSMFGFLLAAMFVATNMLLFRIHAAEPPREIWSHQNSTNLGTAVSDPAGADRSEVILDANGDVIHLWFSKTNSILTKYSSGGGALLWQKEIPVYLKSFQVAEDGSPIVAGSIKEFVDGSELWDLYIAKLDGSSGNLLWEQRHREDRQLDDNIDLKLDGANPIIMSSPVVDLTNDWDAVLTKFSGVDGSQIWQKKLTEPRIGPFTVSTNGTIAVCRANSSNVHVTKLSSENGAIIWSVVKADLTNNFYCTEVIMDQVGNIVLTGLDVSKAYPSYRMYTAKFGATDGGLIWERSVFSPTNANLSFYTFGHRLLALPGGDILALGMRGSENPIDANTPYMVRYAAEDGAELWAKRYVFSDSPNLPQGNSPYLSRLKMDSADGNLVFGVASSMYTRTNYRSATFKISPATGETVWHLTHTNLYLPSFDYKTALLVLSGQERSTLSSVVTLFRGGPELSITPINFTDFEIGWSKDYLGWNLQRLTTSLDSSVPAWTTVPGSESTTTMRLSKELNSGGVFQLVR